MHSSKLRQFLEAVKTGRLTIDKALESLKQLPYEDLDFAKVDHHRQLRLGVPEVIFGQGKTTNDILAIADSMFKKSGSFLITRASREVFKALKKIKSLTGKKVKFYELSGVIAVGEAEEKTGRVLVLCAGTSDIPVAEEAAVTASFLGSKVETISDIGVAGIHRTLDKMKEFSNARVIIVAAGMEAALPSVIGGLTDRPIIAVPTSIGYGTSMGGLAALFTILNSCVPGIAVMNIDNGFGAGCLAHKINIMK
ncbi:MAG TPA: nickel pincer cofactor biosynthesis protein LarB [Nitrospiraceae bacterium]|nr:nickel pincer cofactor biosynthesis protein LarB [Nitrospiraceae bacterium]